VAWRCTTAVVKGRTRDLVTVGVGLAAPAAVATALIPARDHIGSVNVALVLAVVVVAIAAWGHRLAALLAAASAALCFDVLHTHPYYSFSITQRNDAITTALLLIVGIAVGELAVWSRKQQAAAAAGSEDIARMHGVGDLVADGRPLDQVILAVAYELRHLLSLKACRFHPGVSMSGPARIGRDGEVVLHDVHWDVDDMGLPGKEVELLVQWGDFVFGRYVLVPTAGQPLSRERRLVAVALSDQVAAVMAAGQPPTLGNGGHRPTQPTR
jgi:hypothetical protein